MCKTFIIYKKNPDGFIICGWVIKTNSISKPYDVMGNWERKKELQIIGNMIALNLR